MLAEAPCIINRRPAILSLPQYLHGSIAGASDGLPDCSSQHAQLAALARGYGGQHGSRAVPGCHARTLLLLLQTPLLPPRRAMFRKESRRESRHTIAETSNSHRQAYAQRATRQRDNQSGVSCVSWPAREPLNPMLRVEINTQTCCQDEGSRR